MSRKSQQKRPRRRISFHRCSGRGCVQRGSRSGQGIYVYQAGQRVAHNPADQSHGIPGAEFHGQPDGVSGGAEKTDNRMDRRMTPSPKIIMDTKNNHQATTNPTAQREVIERMQRGETLMWHGNAGPQISGRPFWPQKRTVRAMLRDGLLVWGRHFNESQKRLGICPLILSPNDQDQRQSPAPPTP